MSSRFFEKNLDEAWQNLYEEILRKVIREWESAARYYDRFPEVTKQNIESNGVLKALPHLLPLAHELQKDESLHCLMPWQHHGVISLFLMDWEKQRTRAFLMISPRANAYRIYVQDENMPYSARPIETIESVPLGEILPLIHAKLQSKPIQYQGKSNSVQDVSSEVG